MASKTKVRFYYEGRRCTLELFDEDGGSILLIYDSDTESLRLEAFNNKGVRVASCEVSSNDVLDLIGG